MRPMNVCLAMGTASDERAAEARRASKRSCVGKGQETGRCVCGGHCAKQACARNSEHGQQVVCAGGQQISSASCSRTCSLKEGREGCPGTQVACTARTARAARNQSRTANGGLLTPQDAHGRRTDCRLCTAAVLERGWWSERDEAGRVHARAAGARARIYSWQAAGSAQA